jgi:hypothetical protein
LLTSGSAIIGSSIIQIDDDFGEIFRIVVRGQRRLFAGADLRDALVRLVDQALQDLGVVVHALVDHDLDAVLGDFQRSDQGFIVGDADGGLGLHLGGPVGEGEGLVGEQRADVNLDDPALEDVVAVLLQHLGLGGMHDVAEIHVILHGALEGHLDRFRDRHGRLAGRQRQRHGAGIRAEGHALGHAGVAESPPMMIVPVVDRDVVEHLVDHVRHRVVDPSDRAPVIRPKSFMNFIRRGMLAWAFRSHTDAVWQPD